MISHLLIGTAVAAVGLAGAGLGGYELLKKKHVKALATGKATLPPHTALDPGMDTYTGQVVSHALQSETDTNILDSLASALKSANYPNSAQAVAVRSSVVKAALKSGAPGILPASASAASATSHVAQTSASALGTALGKMFASIGSDSGAGSAPSATATSMAASDSGVPHTNFMDAQSLGVQAAAMGDTPSGATATESAAASLFGTSGYFAVGTQVPDYGY